MRLYPWIFTKMFLVPFPFPFPLFHGKVPRKHPLLPRINLIHHILRRVRVPRITRILHHRRQHFLLYQRVLLNRVDVQSPANMPRDVAMEGPRARIIGVVLQHNVCRVRGGAALDELRVAALRVLLIRDDAVPFAETLGEHVEVVAVEVHGVGGDEGVVDDKADGGVGVEVVDGPFWVGVGEVAGIGEGEDGVAGESC